ncbi:MAG: hypothetical protein K2Q26_11165 [Bdellovibrionales bacterium]|nr:hypothetical protein [Bdellovibrionales bacterium]
MKIKLANFSKHKLQKQLKFEKNRGYISFSGDYDDDSNSAKSWLLNILAVPNKDKPDHEHFFLSLGEVKKLHKYLDNYLKELNKHKFKKTN